MSQVTIRLYALLRLKLGAKQVGLTAANVAQALEGLVTKMGTKAGELLFDGDRFRENYVVLLRGRRIRPGDFERVKLEDGDELHIFPPVGGG